MDSHKSNNKARIVFYLLWLVVSIIQASYTELLADEAYYWKYAQDLSWGYFDHPPMVAVFIKAGYAIFQNELGVRLWFIVAELLTFYLLELLVQPKRQVLFYLSISSIGLFHFLGVLALPDMPLLLFTALFLYLYKHYLTRDSWGMVILLGITTTLLLLSKYHGILLVGFTIIAYPAILKRKSFWGIVVISIVLMLPHAVWQLNNDFPSIKYHLSERSSGVYHFEYTLNYLLSVVLLLSPATALVLLWHSLKHKAPQTFDRVLYFFLAGALLFFFVMTYKGPAEANWVSFTIIPIIVLGYKHCEDKIWFPRFTRASFIISLLLIGSLRLYVMYDFLPDIPMFKLAKEKMHHTQAWAKALQQKAGDKPVAFMNKYQYASWYEFYTGKPAISLNNRIGRKNEYNIWEDEYHMQGKDIMMVPNYYIENCDSIITRKGFFQYYYIFNFRSASGVRITTPIKEITLPPSADTDVPFTFHIPSKQNWDLTTSPEIQPVLHTIYFKDGKFYMDKSNGFRITNEMLTDNKEYSTTIIAPEEKGTYTIYLDITMGWLPPSINGEAITLVIE